MFDVLDNPLKHGHLHIAVEAPPAGELSVNMATLSSILMAA